MKSKYFSFLILAVALFFGASKIARADCYDVCANAEDPNACFDNCAGADSADQSYAQSGLGNPSSSGDSIDQSYAQSGLGNPSSDGDSIDQSFAQSGLSDSYYGSGGSSATGSCMDTCRSNGGNDTECASECGSLGTNSGDAYTPILENASINGVSIPQGSRLLPNGSVVSSGGRMLLPAGSVTASNRNSMVLGSTAGAVTAKCGTDGKFKEVAGVCIPQNTGLATTSIKDLLTNLLFWLIDLFSILAVAAFVISGIQYFLSSGNEDLAKSAKKNATNAFIGIIIGLSGYIILKAIQTALSGSTYFF